VAIYMPNVPEAVIAMLACARIGAVHAVIFAGFSSEAVQSRIIDAACRLVITADETYRGGRKIPLKKTIDDALGNCPGVKKVYVYHHPGVAVHMVEGRDIFLDEIMKDQRPYCPAEPMDSEDPLFLLHTSGSTGKPKGLLHTQAGYLLMAAITHKYVFDYHEGDIYACMADVGWITGHSYIVYGPLANGATTFMFEGTPVYPNASRYWQMVERHKITQLYTAPTALRTLMKSDSSYVTKYDRSTLRVLGSVGEPINPEAWRWYHDVVGDGRCVVVDTYWQTESGSHILTPLPGCIPTKPGSATFPMFGYDLAILDPKTGALLTGNDVRGLLVVKQPWPSMARSIIGDHTKYLDTYFKPYPGYYFTGDGVWRDKDGFYWIEGRVDDVINVSGHRIGTAEVESALSTHKAVAEAAVVGFPHEIKGQGIAVYCILRDGFKESKELEAQLRAEVRRIIGPFASPDIIVFTHALPKVRSGKIVRRLLRKIVVRETSPEHLGDISTLAEPEIVPFLVNKMEQILQRQQ